MLLILWHEGDDTIDDEDESEAASWLLFDGPAPKNSQNGNTKESGFLYNGEGGEDEYLEFMEFGGDDQQQCFNKGSEKMYSAKGEADSVVPVQKNHHQFHHHEVHNQKFQLGMEYESSNGGASGGYGYPVLTHSVSFYIK